MGKNKKEHRKKVIKRNEKILQDKNRVSKLTNEFMTRFMKEKEDGLFNDENLINVTDNEATT